jgi:glycosyltransferase involved in cell wall biosynthesis
MNESQELVSVIVPIFNTEMYLKQCVSSIVNQSYTHLEIILVDDGSTDKSLSICQEFQKKDRRVTVFQQENKGCFEARNTGLLHAHGTYIYFFDSDDIMQLNAIERMVAKIKKEKADLVIGSYSEINQKGEFIQNKSLVKLYSNDSPVFQYASLVPFPGNKLFCSSILKENQLFWRKLQMAEDLIFYLEYLLYCKKVVLLEENVLEYRIVDNSLSRKYDLKILGIKDAFLKLEEVYMAHDAMDLFLEYIEPLKIAHYYYQFSKIKFYKKQDRKIINTFFKKERKVLKKEKNKSPYLKKFYYKFRMKNFYYSIF